MKQDHLITQACRAAGGSSALARLVGVSPAIVYQWRTGIRPVPADRCASIEMAASQSVMRWDLRPADWHLIWPELRARSDAPPIPDSSAGPASTQAQNARNPQEIAA
jgi:DNA-binding transcriptional regulator YdaS (Cro superfamily)